MTSISYRIKQLQDTGRAVWLERRLGRHDHWDRERLERHQHRQLLALLRHAVAHSPFYRELYAGLRIDEGITVNDLPIIDKKRMMEAFDQVVTDPRLKLADLRAHLKTVQSDVYYLDQYRVLATTGTSGLRGIFVYNRPEWSHVLADALRWHRYMGIKPRFPKRTRISAIGADTPIHVTARMTQSANVGLFNFQLLRVTEALTDLVAALNAFQPEVLLAYPSLTAALAVEQMEGRLHIRPKVVSNHSEVQTEDMARKVQQAWGVLPFNHYGLSEMPNFAAECDRHEGLHIFEDLVLPEIVDDEYRPVPPGRQGTRLLLTNLFNYTQPIIRYEVSDMLTLAPEACSCGRSFRTIASIGGRAEDMLTLAGREGGTVTIAPMAITVLLDSIDEVAEYQFVHGEPEFRLRIVPRSGATREDLQAALRREVTSRIEELGAVPPPISVEFVDHLERTSERMGKVKLVQPAPG